MRDSLITILNFLGGWIIYTFSTYQGAMEIAEQKSIIHKIKDVSKSYKDVSPLYWFFPPLKIHLETKRFKAIFKEFSSQNDDFEEVFTISNKATAWFYVGIGSLLNCVGTTDALLDFLNIELNDFLFALLFIVLMVLCLVSIFYRMSDKARNKLFKRYTDK